MNIVVKHVGFVLEEAGAVLIEKHGTIGVILKFECLVTKGLTT